MGNFVFAINNADLGLMGCSVMGPFTVLLAVMIKLVHSVVYRVQHGRWLKEKDSVLLFDSPNRTVKWYNLLPVCGAALPTVANTLLLTYAWQFASVSGVNQGIVSSVGTFSSIIDILTFYYFLGERTNIVQFIGIGLMLLSITMISLASGGEGNHDTEIDADER